MISIYLHVVDAASFFAHRYYEGIVSFDPAFVLGTVLLLCATIKDISFSCLSKAKLIRFAKYLPVIGNIFQKRIDSVLQDIHKAIHGDSEVTYEKQLPTYGLTMDRILKKAKEYSMMQSVKWKEGFTSGCVYGSVDTVAQLSTKMFENFLLSNPLHPNVFPDVRRMEAEVVRMCLTMFHGDEDSCGTMTSGGTESVILACLAYRELAKEEKGIERPAMIIAESAHPAFDKAAFYFNIDIIRVQVNPDTLKVDVDDIRGAITKNTCMLMASAPGFPHGVIDPVEEIAMLGWKHRIPVHVDCCLGGFLLPFMKSAGYSVGPFDFRLPGVTSISCDTHKYGFTAKGSSVVLFRNKTYRARQFFTQPNWPGGVYASPTLAGSRSGSIIAVSWATMLHIGENGYVKATRRIIDTTRYIEKGLRKIPGIMVLGQPEVSVIAFTSNLFNIYQLSHQLASLPNGDGWILNNLQSPPAVHLCVTDLHTTKGRAEAFLRDVSKVAEELRCKPRNYAERAAVIYGISATIPDRTLVSLFAKAFLDECYDTPSAHPPSTSERE